LKYQNTTSDICRKRREKSETSQYITDARRALAQGDYTYRHNPVAKTVHQELVIKCGLSNGPPMLYYTCAPQFVLENSSCTRP